MSDQQLIDLYSGRILELATQVPCTDPIAEPQITARKRAPLCGSTIAVAFDIQDGRITRFSQNVKACALGQAAASVVGQAIVGQDLASVKKARSELAQMLKSDGPGPNAPFQDLEVLRPARDFANRHASILLCLDAIIEGWEKHQSSQPIQGQD